MDFRQLSSDGSKKVINQKYEINKSETNKPETKKANSMSWLFDFPIKENMVEGDGFEPSKAVPADLQSAPFGHSGTPPGCVLLFTK